MAIEEEMKVLGRAEKDQIEDRQAVLNTVVFVEIEDQVILRFDLKKRNKNIFFFA